MNFKKPLLFILLAASLASCSGSKPYSCAVVDKSGMITDIVLDNVYAEAPVLSEPSGTQYSVVCLHFSKVQDDAADKTINLSDIKAYMGSNAFTPVSFCGGIGSGATEKGSYVYASSKSTTFVLAKNEHYVIPDCYVCFELKAIDKTATFKVKDQEINHDLNNPSKIEL